MTEAPPSEYSYTSQKSVNLNLLVVLSFWPFLTKVAAIRPESSVLFNHNSANLYGMELWLCDWL